MSLELAEQLLFPAGRGFVPFPVRRSLLRFLEAEEEPALTQAVYRVPRDPKQPPRAWQTNSGYSWLRLEAALAGSVRAESASDWLALNGPCDSPAEEAFVRTVIAPALGARGLRALRAQEAFPLPEGGVGRIDFVLSLGGVRVALEVDGIEYHEGLGPDGRRPERERDRQNALVAAGYILLRYTGREILQDPSGTAERLLRDLESLGLLSEGERSSNTAPLDISSATHALLGAWPRDFIRAQQAALDLLKSESGWLDAEHRVLLFPRSDRGAALLGFLDTLDAALSAGRLLGEIPVLRSVAVWAGDHSEVVARLIEDRVSGRSRQLPFEVELIDGPAPQGADLLMVSASATELTDAELSELLTCLNDTARIVWCSDVDTPGGRPPAVSPTYFPSPSRPEVEHLLERFFGFPSFREGQWEIVEQLLRGSSTLGVLPTGAGKTVCFQLPALLQPGLAIVVSPLVSLMDDQVMNLRSMGLDFAGRAHSRLSEDELEEELRRFKEGAYKLFYVSPERFHSQRFISQLAALTKQHSIPISYFVVDEAHLASEWGHDFRPSYLTLPYAREAISPLAPIALLTATAPRPIRDDLAAIFKQSCELTMVLPPTFDRPELSFEVRQVTDDWQREQAVLSLVRSELPRSLGYEDFSELHGIEPGEEHVLNGGLVFTPWGKPNENRGAIRAASLAASLRDKGLRVEDYRSSTAEQENLDRAALNRHTQERFKRNELPLIVATKGFGTGIDKPDIRYVVHADMPGSMEALYQEAGRAGRDGLDARAAMIWRPRAEECRPEKSAPMCASTWECPFGLAELCSFGIQASLRSGSQPGAAAEIETSLTVWRRYFVYANDSDRVRIPRALRVDAITREEVIEQIEEILWHLHMLGLCGAPSVPSDPKKPIFVENTMFSAEHVRQYVQEIRPGARSPQGKSDESFITDAVRLAFNLSEQEAQNHTAVWAMYLRHRQLTAKKTPVPRLSSSRQSQQRPDVERLLTRLLTLGVVRSYRYEGASHWSVELCLALERSVDILEQRLEAAISRHRGAQTLASPLPRLWSEAVEVAITRLIQSWYDTIAVRSWETLESLEEFAGARDCRRRRIAQYMNESAVSIPSPCGHCDNCGIQRLVELKPVTVDEQARQRVEVFNEAFDALVDAPDDLEGVSSFLELARAVEQLEAVRDRAARHLERAPFDRSPRLAASLAARELGEPQVAERHLRMLLETIGSAGDVSALKSVLGLWPRPPAAVLEDMDRLLLGLPDIQRHLIIYRLEYNQDQRRAARRAVLIARWAGTSLNQPTADRGAP
jgi:RecQ family ATP-dependent DNA helicase